MVEPNNTLGMFRSLTWHTQLQQILTSPAAEYNLLREKKLVDKAHLQLPPTGSAVRLDSGLAPDAGRYAEIEVTFELDANGIMNIQAKDKGLDLVIFPAQLALSGPVSAENQPTWFLLLVLSDVVLWADLVGHFFVPMSAEGMLVPPTPAQTVSAAC